MKQFYDALETRDPEVRERALLERLPEHIAHAKAHALAYAELLSDIDAQEVRSRESLAQVPLTRKSDLVERQKAAPPFGGYAAAQWGESLRVFASPGPIYEPEGATQDYWRLARGLFAAGFRRGELIHNGFAYHLTPAGAFVDSAARALGCTVFPGGTGQTEAQVQAMAHLRPHGYVGTPSLLKILCDKADEMGVRVDSVRKAVMSGEAFPAPLREACSARGIDAYQVYATADLGNVAYETSAREGLVIEEGVLVEIVRPGTGAPVAAGEVGEVVVTPLFNMAYPLVRFATGDLSAILPGASSCGRTNARLRGWLGRADQTTKVKGMFVHPAHVAQVVARHAGLGRARLVVENPDGLDRMTLEVEHPSGGADVAEAIAASLREATRLRGEIAFVPPGSLPNDGKVIDDRRKLS